LERFEVFIKSERPIKTQLISINFAVQFSLRRTFSCIVQGSLMVLSERFDLILMNMERSPTRTEFSVLLRPEVSVTAMSSASEQLSF
jgi:hypothetical protein